MPTKIGHFEILSELAKSATGAVYKATDPQTSQTVALKAIQLSAFGERAGELNHLQYLGRFVCGGVRVAGRD